MKWLRGSIFEGAVLIGFCAFSMNAQLRYRIAQGDVTLILNWMGLVFAAMALIVFIRGWLANWLGKSHPLIIAVDKWHQLFVICICGYFLYSLLLFVNARSDAPIENRLATTTSKGRSLTFTDDFQAYEWAGVHFRDSDSADMTLLLNNQEADHIWPGLAVEVKLKRGLLGFMHVVAIERDVAQLYRDVLKVAPTATQALSSLASQYAREGNMQGAVDMSKRYLAISNDSSAIGYIAADLFQRHRLADAYLLDVLVYEKLPDQDHTIGLGWILAKMGRYQEAMPYLKKGVVMDPTSMLGYYHLAYVQADMGLKDEAIKNFREVLKRKPNYPEIRAAIRRMGATP